ncbi:hypothetical protein D3C81_436620 [compost metagenome]
MAKSMIAQIREEIETFLVGHNMIFDQTLRLVEHPDPHSNVYRFMLRSKWIFSDKFVFEFVKTINKIHVTIYGNEHFKDNIDYLKNKYKVIYGDKGSVKWIFSLNKPSDVYEILVKFQDQYNIIKEEW